MKSIKGTYSTVLISACFFVACSGDEVVVEDSVHEYHESNQLPNVQPIPKEEFVELTSDKAFLSKSKELNGLKYDARPVPTDLMALRILGDDYNEERLDSLRKELQGIAYFEFRIEAPGSLTEVAKVGLTSMAEYQERIEYMAFEMQNNYSLQIDAESKECFIYHFERTYNIAPYSTFLLGFELSEEEEHKERTLVFDDDVFGAGRLKFKWTPNEFNWVPKIATNEN